MDIVEQGIDHGTFRTSIYLIVVHIAVGFLKCFNERDVGSVLVLTPSEHSAAVRDFYSYAFDRFIYASMLLSLHPWR